MAAAKESILVLPAEVTQHQQVQASKPQMRLCLMNEGKTVLLEVSPYEVIICYRQMLQHLRKYPSDLGTSPETGGSTASFLWSQKILISLIPKGVFLQSPRNSAPK